MRQMPGRIHINIEVAKKFLVDSSEYHILTNAALNIKGVEGAVAEIGSRRCGSTRAMIDALYSIDDTNRPLFCIDPYGNIPCEVTNKAVKIHHPHQADLLKGDHDSTDISNVYRFDFTNAMRDESIPYIHIYAAAAGFNFNFFCMEDHEFFKRFKDGVPVYENAKRFVKEYALVFFDGPHTNPVVKQEIDFFIPRSNVGTMFVFDDIWMYDHDKIEKVLFRKGFELVEKGTIKASYRRVT